MDGYCTRCSGISTLIAGVVFLLNAWFSLIDPWILLGLVLALAGLGHIVKPSCGCGGGCCMPEAPVKAVSAKKKQ